MRGAASLQYGTQFGGLVNFKLKDAPTDKKIQLVSRETYGSWNFLNAFNNVQLGHPNINYSCPYGQECSSGAFGLVNTSQPARNVQFALKFYY